MVRKLSYCENARGGDRGREAPPVVGPGNACITKKLAGDRSTLNNGT